MEQLNKPKQEAAQDVADLQNRLDNLRRQKEAFNDDGSGAGRAKDNAEIARLEQLIAERQHGGGEEAGEAATQDAPESAEEIVFSGDWSKGERPEGYVSISAKISSLRQMGFNDKEVLKKHFGVGSEEIILDHNKIMAKARSGAPLSKSDVEYLLKVNKALVGAADEFEKVHRLKKELGMPTEQQTIDAANAASPESLESEKKIQRMCGDLAVSLSEVVRIARRRNQEDLDDLFDSRVPKMRGIVESLDLISKKSDGIVEADALALLESVKELTKIFGSIESSGRTGLHENEDDLRRLKLTIDDFDEKIQVFQARTRDDKTVKFDGLSSLLGGLRVRVENFNDLLTRRRVALARYLER